MNRLSRALTGLGTIGLAVLALALPSAIDSFLPTVDVSARSHRGAHDPWGRPYLRTSLRGYREGSWYVKRDMGGWLLVYSKGPDGLDSGGAGDDMVCLPPSHPAILARSQTRPAAVLLGGVAWVSGLLLSRRSTALTGALLLAVVLGVTPLLVRPLGEGLLCSFTFDPGQVTFALTDSATLPLTFHVVVAMYLLLAIVLGVVAGRGWSPDQSSHPRSE